MIIWEIHNEDKDTSYGDMEKKGKDAKLNYKNSEEAAKEEM